MSEQKNYCPRLLRCNRCEGKGRLTVPNPQTDEMDGKYITDCPDCNGEGYIPDDLPMCDWINTQPQAPGDGDEGVA